MFRVGISVGHNNVNFEGHLQMGSIENNKLTENDKLVEKTNW